MKLKILLSLIISTSIFIVSCQQKDIFNNPQKEQILDNNFEVPQLNFKKVSQESLLKYNKLGLQGVQDPQNTNDFPTSGVIPMPSASPTQESSSYSGISSVAGFYQKYTVIDFEETKLRGFVGSYSEIVTKVVKPIIKNLSLDAQLTYANGALDTKGLNKNSAPLNINEPRPVYSAFPYPDSYYDQYRWIFTFFSPSKKEVYNFLISSESTIILKQKLELTDLSYDNIKIDSAQAINIITNTIKNKTILSPKQNIAYMESDTEVIYDLSKNTNWYFYLEKQNNSLVWNITFTVSPPSTQNDFKYYYSDGYAIVDASTGNVLEFVRATKYTNVNRQYTNFIPYPQTTAYPNPETDQTYNPIPTATPYSETTAYPNPQETYRP